VNILLLPVEGPVLDATDLVAQALGEQADLVSLPASRLADGFFDLRTGVAGEYAQKFVNYRVRLAVIGDISAHTERSEALRAFVAESNRGRQLWFVRSQADLDDRLRRESDRPQ
jgi:Domain of unknown function (DUF4180)